MRNKYPDNCYRCGKLVESGAGHFERYKGHWRVQHARCCLEHRKLTLVHAVEKPKAEHEEEIIDAAITHAEKLSW
jgi:hypothetical protein